MCGLFGIYSDRPVDNLLPMMKRAAGALQHRGPDQEGFYESPTGLSGLVHRRLNVMAPENGRQPLTNEDGSVLAIVNGEFYGSDAVRTELSKRGHSFETATDSEILVHLYEEYGKGCLAHLRGEFAFVLWDEKRRILFAARDRFGVKPLLYANDRGTIKLASEAKALFAVGVKPAWDMESFFFATSVQYLPQNRSLFAGVEMLPPGHFLIAEGNSCSIDCYWDLPVSSAPSSLSGAELIAACSAQVKDAVCIRQRANARVCYQLSGGLDSSSVAGIAARESSGPIDLFNISFPESAYNEFDVAKRTAEWLNANLHRVDISQNQILQHLPDAVRSSEGLSINGHVAAKYILHQRIQAAGFKVVMTGEGADEAFYGYTHLRMDYWRSTGQSVPVNLLETDVTSKGMMLADGESLPLEGALGRFGCLPAWLRAKATLGWKTRRLLRDDFVNEFSKRDPIKEFASLFLSNHDDVYGSRSSWTKTALAGYILKTLGDGTEMPCSVEGRVPYLDHKLWEFLADVPIDSQIQAQRDKPLIRDSVKGFVTPEVFQRPKHPFDAPPVSVFAGDEGREFFYDHLNSEAATSQPFFCPQKIQLQIAELEKHEQLRQVWDPPLMLFLSTLFLQDLLEP